MGDGALVEFASVVDAVACAVAIQRGMAEREAEPAEDERIRFRIGINLGDVLVDGDDLYGDGVNIAARLEGWPSRAVSCSPRAAFDQVVGKLPVTARDLGEQPLKNIARPVRAYAIGEVARATTRTAARRRWPVVAARDARDSWLRRPLGCSGRSQRAPHVRREHRAQARRRAAGDRPCCRSPTSPIRPMLISATG